MGTDLTASATTLEREPVVNCAWTAEQVDLGLLTLAIIGDSDKAAGMLKAAGISVSARTLRHWRLKKYPRRFQLLQESHGRAIEDQLVNGVRDIAAAAQHGTLEAIELERQRIKAGDVKDASASARNLATALGIATDKTLILTGRPSAITETRDGASALRQAEALGFITHEDDDIPDAEVIDAREAAMPALPAVD